MTDTIRDAINADVDSLPAPPPIVIRSSAEVQAELTLIGLELHHVKDERTEQMVRMAAAKEAYERLGSTEIDLGQRRETLISELLIAIEREIAAKYERRLIAEAAG